MNVFAVDGSKYTLPASDELREHFQPRSGLGKGTSHYPQCLVSTVYDVLRRFPIARTVCPADSSERDEAMAMLTHVPSGGVFIADRGYPSHEFIANLHKDYNGYFLLRSPATQTFSAVTRFLAAGGVDGEIILQPSADHIKRHPNCSREPIRLRVIRIKSEDGTISVLLTNLLDRREFKTCEIRHLYHRRWKIEEHYRDEKCSLEVERFHSKSINGILQEIHIAMVLSVIARMLIRLNQGVENDIDSKSEPQFKNAVISLAAEAFILIGKGVCRAKDIFCELLECIREVRYHPPKRKRPKQPRISKKALNKWILVRGKIVRSASAERENTGCKL